MHSLGCGGHRLEKRILTERLLKYIARVVIDAGGVYQRLALGRGDADALAFQHTAEPAHGVAFEVGKIYQEVIVGKMASNTVKFQIFCIFNR